MASSFAENDFENMIGNIDFDDLSFSDDDEKELTTEFDECEIVVEEEEIEMPKYINYEVEKAEVRIKFVFDEQIPMVLVACGEVEDHQEPEKPKLLCSRCGKPYNRQKWLDKRLEKCGKLTESMGYV